ncbi:hypothetical protein [Mesorhizobium sp. CAU 1741]|uniref:hypothetical protein n=1 Tax=Mesorhizobium sp. CAU 1741 TaxID=3140366 RepID=UPI00325AA5D0
MRIQRLLAATAALTAICLSAARADERPLIWELAKVSDSSYAARLGSRLPTPIESRIGAEFHLRGPDPRSFDDPIALWGSLQLAERSKPGDIRTTSLDASVEGAEGNRRLALTNSFTFSLSSFDAELRQELAIDYQPQGDRQPHVQELQSIHFALPRARTEFHATATRRDRQKWVTTIAVKQPLLDGIELSATLEKPRSKARKGYLRATYSYNW